MKCDNCEVDVKATIQTGKLGICNNCINELHNVSSNNKRIENEILAYIHKNAMARSPEEIINECAEKYTPKDILDAKTCLLNVYGNKIKETNTKIHEELCKKRIDSHGRKAFIANLHDIMTAYETLDGIQCDISAIIDVKTPLKVSNNAESTTLETRVAQLEKKFSLIESLNGENAKLRDDNVRQIREIQDLKDHVALIKGELEHAYAKVDSLVAENVALKQCSDENGLTKWKTLMNGLNSPSHEPEETPPHLPYHYSTYRGVRCRERRWCHR